MRESVVSKWKKEKALVSTCSENTKACSRAATRGTPAIARKKRSHLPSDLASVAPR